MIRSISLGPVAEAVNNALDEPIGGQTITEMLKDFADQHGIPL